MNTNFQMIQELKEFKAEHRGFLTGEEVKYIEDTLHLREMDELALRNMRDFAMLYYCLQLDKHENDYKTQAQLMDVRSGIAGVIDNLLWNMGCEV